MRGTAVTTPPENPSGSGLERPASASTSPRVHWSDQLLRRITDYLPLLLALLLALTSFWLVRSMPKIRQPGPPLPADAPDYYLREFVLRRYGAQGALQDELTGTYGEHIPGPDTIHVQQARMLSIDAQGNSTRSSANRAIAYRQNQDIELFDQVHVVRQRAPNREGITPPPTVFESDYLRSTGQQEHISTDQSVTIVRDGNIITGTGMTYTSNSRTVEVQGRARAVIQPKK